MKRLAPLLWLSIVGIAAWVLSERLRAIDFDDVIRQLRSLPASAMLGGIACCFASYTLVGFAEGLALRIATGRREVLLPLRTALIANPIGRAIGAALVSGGAVRYRMYTAVGLSSRQVGAVILLAAMPYFLGVGWLIDLSLLFNAQEAGAALRLSTGAVLALAALGLAKDIGWLVVVSIRKQPLKIGQLPLRLPTLRDTLKQIAFGATQVSLIATILYIFLSPALGMSLPAFIAIYCIAFVAGQLSHVPAGLGVLEAALLLMLPQVPPAQLLGAVLAYRAVFELLPLLIALLLWLVYESASEAGVIRRRWARKVEQKAPLP